MYFWWGCDLRGCLRFVVDYMCNTVTVNGNLDVVITFFVWVV